MRQRFIFDGTLGKEYAHRMPIMLGLLGDKGKVLDIGDKKNGPIAKALTRSGYDVTTVDIKDADVNLDLNGGRLPFVDKEFDYVVAGEVFEHIFHLKKLLKEINRILNHSGFLIFSTPNLVSLVDRMKVLFGKLPTNCALGDYLEDHGHVRDFSWGLARKYLRDAGFKSVEEKTDGVAFRGKLLLGFCPKNLGSSIIIKAKKSNQEKSR